MAKAGAVISDQRRIPPIHLARWGWLLPVALFLALTLPTIDRAGISWDEQTDLDIARSYVSAPGEWLGGSHEEPTQTRLPMYVVAAVYRMLGTQTLRTARVVSCLMGILILIGVYLYAARQLGPTVALIATTLLGVNPFFVAFARVAFTEGDVYVTAGVIWLLLCAAHLTQQRTIGWAALAGFALGIAMSAKFLAVAMLPVLAAAPWLHPRNAIDDEQSLETREVARLLVMLACTGGLLALLAAGFYVFRPVPSRQFWPMVAAYGAGLAAALGVAGYVMLRRDRVASPVVLSIVAVGIAGMTFVLVPPVHLTDSAILGSLAKEVLRSAPLDPAFAIHAAELHFLCVLIKPSPLVGAALWSAFVICLFRARREQWLRLPLLMTLAYLLFLIKMNVAQTFYSMAILPILTILCAEQWTRWVTRRRWLAWPVAAACVLMASDLARSYPDYQLNGYQWLGARYIGTVPALAYRGPAQLTTDGIQQSLEWVNRHVPDRAVVRTYIYANHIVRALSPAPRYQLVDGLREGGDIDGADYVVTSLHAEVGRGWQTPNAPFVARPYDRDRLLHHFEKVYSVDRAFGLEVAAVWRHRADGDRPAAVLAR